MGSDISLAVTNTAIRAYSSKFCFVIPFRLHDGLDCGRERESSPRPGQASVHSEADDYDMRKNVQGRSCSLNLSHFQLLMSSFDDLGAKREG